MSPWADYTFLSLWRLNLVIPKTTSCSSSFIPKVKMTEHTFHVCFVFMLGRFMGTEHSFWIKQRQKEEKEETDTYENLCSSRKLHNIRRNPKHVPRKHTLKVRAYLWLQPLLNICAIIGGICKQRQRARAACMLFCVCLSLKCVHVCVCGHRTLWFGL